MREHYLKGKSIWDVKTYPMDSFAWKNIITARQSASLYMYQNLLDEWCWTASLLTL